MGAKITKVLNGLYIGTHSSACDEEELLNNAITSIISIHTEHVELNINNHFELKKLLVKENEISSFLKIIPTLNNLIHNVRMMKGNVLVCSQAGSSLNVSSIAVYLMSIFESIGKKEALCFIDYQMRNTQPLNEIFQLLNAFDTAHCVKTGTMKESSCCLVSERQRIIKLYPVYESKEEDLNIINEILSREDCKMLSDEISALVSGIGSLSVDKKGESQKSSPREKKVQVKTPVLSFDDYNEDEIFMDAIELESTEDHASTTEDPLSDSAVEEDENEAAIDIPMTRGQMSINHSTARSFFAPSSNFDSPRFANNNKNADNPKYETMRNLSTTVPNRNFFINT